MYLVEEVISAHLAGKFGAPALDWLHLSGPSLPDSLLFSWVPIYDCMGSCRNRLLKQNSGT
ncbi:hypothetical protein DPMN_002792 [Dreissena polymorpha]|uniref:Uncharacterized protein n=1 Tax=Dreissena polymorpha TaxID=45954 RepID=A0A9D4MNT4_DREPO|nr:hypothetical protein DPMN_190610 [Dreissena polymorpha]KAH3878891.1 hypothetical protein DPMN_002792 [Dreissena polymorpha]